MTSFLRALVARSRGIPLLSYSRLCPGFAGDGGGGLHASLTFSTLLFTRLRSCGLAVQQTSMAWAKTHALPVIHVDGGPKRLYLLAWSSAREGWFEIRYKHDWLPPRAYVEVNFVDLSLRQLAPAMIPGFDAGSSPPRLRQSSHIS